MYQKSSPTCYLGTVFVFVISIVALLILASQTVQDIVDSLEQIRSRTSSDRSEPPRCEFPLVYNKPPKTASTKIRDDLAEWGEAVNRNVYKCSPFVLEATFQMRECIPYDLDGCAVVATHLILSDGMRGLLKSRIGDFRLLTSTREPGHRIFSLFLQVTRTKASIAAKNLKLVQDFLSKFNPWELYNYHTGEGREGSCPLSLQDVATITDLVNSFDIVIDADLPDISNAILNYTNLFQLTDAIANKRTSEGYNYTVLDQNTKDMVKSVSCVEDEMHRMFRLRIASLYQKATGIECLSKSRYPVPTCF